MNRTVRNGLAVATMAGGIFLLGQAVASADTTGSSDSASSGSSSTSETTVTSTATGGDATAYGHEVEVAPTQSAESGGNVGVANSGNEVSVGSASAGSSSGSNGNPQTSSGNASVTNDGGNAGNEVGNTTVSGNTTATGGSASTGDTSGSADSASVGGGGSSSSGGESTASSSSNSSSGSGASTTATSTATGGDADAEGHIVVVAPTQVAASYGNYGEANSGNVVTVVCFNFKSSSNCSPVTSSGNASVSNTGGNAGNSVGNTTVSGNTSATGGNAATGDTDGTSDSFDVWLAWLASLMQGTGGGYASTDVSSTSTGGSGTAYGHEVYVAPWQYAVSGGNEGYANSGNVVQVYCFNFKSNNNCNPVTHSGNASVSNTGGNAGNSVGSTTVGGNTSAAGGNAQTGSTSGSSDQASIGSGSGGASTVVDNSATGGSAAAGGHLVVVAPWQMAYSGGNYGWANSGNQVVVYCFNFKSDNNCNPVTHSGDATVVNTGGNAGNVVGDTTVTGCTSAVGGSAGGGTTSGGCPAEQPAQGGHEGQGGHEPTAPATEPVATAPVQHVAPVQHIAPVATGSGSHVTTVSASHSSPATLAYTGADVSDALGLGLVALAGGLGLALAGRRRTAA